MSNVRASLKPMPPRAACLLGRRASVFGAVWLLVWRWFKFFGFSLGLVLWYVLFGGFSLVFGWWGLLLGRAVLVFNSVVVLALVAVKLLALTHPLSGTPDGAPYVKR
jgi:hypothetical protein